MPLEICSRASLKSDDWLLNGVLHKYDKYDTYGQYDKHDKYDKYQQVNSVKSYIRGRLRGRVRCV